MMIEIVVGGGGSSVSYSNSLRESKAIHTVTEKRQREDEREKEKNLRERRF